MSISNLYNSNNDTLYCKELNSTIINSNNINTTNLNTTNLNLTNLNATGTISSPLVVTNLALIGTENVTTANIINGNITTANIGNIYSLQTTTNLQITGIVEASPISCPTNISVVGNIANISISTPLLTSNNASSTITFFCPEKITNFVSVDDVIGSLLVILSPPAITTAPSKIIAVTTTQTCTSTFGIIPLGTNFSCNLQFSVVL